MPDYVCNSTGVLKKVMLARPDYAALRPINVIANKWLDKGGGLNLDTCLREHADLERVYRANGVETVVAPGVEGLTNLVFARDFGACVREGYIRGRYKEPVRFGESDVFEEQLQTLGVPRVASCDTGVFEGGDFWFLDDYTLAVGMVARTDEAGFESLRTQLEPLGYNMTGVPCERSNLHLDMCFNIAAERVAVICEDALPDFFLNILRQRRFELINVAQEDVYKHYCNLQCLGGGNVISFAANKTVNDKMRVLGLNVIEIELTETLKMGGGPHCMTFPLSREK
jgi:N-dimethylarginine dimethylaminohydrolase